ncbi:MAG: hypothetical protein ACREUW_04760 [Burkholderiales bacterium]
MKLNQLLPVIERMRMDLRLKDDLRAVTYLATYPSICSLGTNPKAIHAERFHQLAAMAYGWMPRILRLNPHCMRDAVAALVQAQNATNESFLSAELIRVISRCLYSVVGASKVLHFTNPSVFPIWDSKIERFRKSAEPTHAHMKQVEHYLDYSQEIQAIRHEGGFSKFYSEYKSAFDARLTALGITSYGVSEVRVIEAAAFELASR